MAHPPNRGKGTGIAFLKAHLCYEGDDCLVWPLMRDRGYGRVYWLGRHYWSHRLMCLLAHGEPPTSKHYATHSCGSGHLGCVNPKHLEWKTPTENQADRRVHGRAGLGIKKPKRKLTLAQVAEIHALNGRKSQQAIAEMYGVSQRSVCDILRGKNWKHAQPERVGLESSAHQRG